MSRKMVVVAETLKMVFFPISTVLLLWLVVYVVSISLEHIILVKLDIYTQCLSNWLDFLQVGFKSKYRLKQTPDFAYDVPLDGQESVNGDQISHQFGSVRSRCSHHRPSTAPITRFINRPPTNRIFQCPLKTDRLFTHPSPSSGGLFPWCVQWKYQGHPKYPSDVLARHTIDNPWCPGSRLHRIGTVFDKSSRVEVLLFSEHSLRSCQNNYQKYGLELPPTQDASHYQDYYINE